MQKHHLGFVPFSNATQRQSQALNLSRVSTEYLLEFDVISVNEKERVMHK